MAETLQNRVAIVVGASSGMGRATATLLARSGATVMLAARRKSQLEELRDELTEQGASAAICPTDTASREDVERLIETTIGQFGRIDLLVYATGTNIPDRALDVLTPDTWEMMLATNLTGALLCTKAVLPTMREQGEGQIVYLSSAAVQMPDVSGVAYQASKHGLSGLAHGTRAEEKQNGVRTTVIFPGLCDTEILDKRPTPTPRDVLDRALDPMDVAEAVLFVAQLHPRAVVPELQLLPSAL
ncbi:MAG: SDR family oxidoreductase [Planctomycetaceae bacterium]|jgi:serine 3-dehydrogenase (NADP+)|nr:SDR family oxidoreductase [Planctomycetaceae bacterium]MBT6156973.1 SDR family oxidoreductase [Planctomycetaceae bacterium]MBT6484641.1 SDR family oxidoreductase [Planctomycetaceae bacterium]MBT6494835.1 SDR family oxidoreductase [Planctomycetaceae bacterium]